MLHLYTKTFHLFNINISFFLSMFETHLFKFFSLFFFYNYGPGAHSFERGAVAQDSL